MLKSPPAMQETWVQSLGWEDPLEEGMATHSRILAWRIPMDKEAWWATVHGVTKSWTRLNRHTQSFCFIWDRDLSPPESACNVGDLG